VRNDDGHLCSLAAPGKWQIVYEPGKWKRGGAGSKLFAVSSAELACQYGKIERGHFRRLWHNPPAGTILVGQIKLVRRIWPED
jgi:hypothetical protein